MELIRNNIFETNSSSSHSLVIKHRDDPESKPISDYPVLILRGVDNIAYGGDNDVDIKKYITEVDKANMLVNILATIYTEKYESDWRYETYRSTINKEAYISKFFNKMIQSELFVAFSDVIKGQTGTEIKFDRRNQEPPFYDGVYSDNLEMIEEMLHIDDINEFKNIIKDIIFNKDIIVIDASIPYGTSNNILDEIG